MSQQFEIETYNQYGLKDKAKTDTCPKCSAERKKKSEKCLMLDWEKGLGTCQHCGEVLQLHTYKSNGEAKKEYTALPMPVLCELSDRVKEFFKGRGISERALSVAKVSEGKDWMPQFGQEVHTIHFNYFENGKLVNTKYRGAKKSFKLAKGGKLTLSGIDRWKDSKEVSIVEGEIDELSFIEAGINDVASVPNGATLGNINLDYLDNCIDFFENKERIVIAVDNDEAGKNLQKELVRRLGAERCYLADFGEYKDANELLEKEGTEALRKAYLSAKPCPLENVNTYEDEKEAYYAFLENGLAKGMTINLPSFDANFSTYTGQFIVVTGIPSHGKSDFVDQMCLGYALNESSKIAYASPENKPNILHINKLIAKMLGKFPKKEDIGTPIFKECEKFIDDYINFIDYEGAYNFDDVLAKAAELVKRKGIKVLVIDPYNKVTMKDKNRSDDSYTAEYLLKIDEFARKYDVLPIIVAHPTKMKKVQGESKPPMPDFYDIRGSGDFYDMSPHGLCVYRDFEQEIVRIKNLKVKFSFQGVTGAETITMWNPANGRYSEVMGDDTTGYSPIFDNEPWIRISEEVEPKNTIKPQQENEFLSNNDFTYELPEKDVPF